MTEIPELSGDIDIMRTKLNKQAELLRAQTETIRELREAMGEAREVIFTLMADAPTHRAACEVASAWLATHKEE